MLPTFSLKNCRKCGYSQGASYVLNGNGSNPRLSQGQYWTFTDTKPMGKYVGYKLYQAETYGNTRLDLYDIGVYGTAKFNVSDFVSVEESVGTAAAKAVAYGEAGATYSVVDADSNEATYFEDGKKYTLTTSNTNDEFVFDGWYKGETKVSSDKSFTVDSYAAGDIYTAKYVTNVIIKLDAENSSVNLNNTLISEYDEQEQALKFNVTKAANIKNGVGGSHNIVSFTVDDKDALATQYKPWTTYKLTLKVKYEYKDGKRVHFSYAPSVITSGTATYINSGEDYKTLTYYFNSGAADFDRNDHIVGTKSLNKNAINIAQTDIAEGENATYYLKDFVIERVDNVTVDAEKATVTLADATGLGYVQLEGVEDNMED